MATAGIGMQTTQPVEATQVPASTDWLSLAATLPATIQVYDRDRGYIEIPNPEIDVYRMAAIQDQWMSQPFSPVMNTRYDPATYGAAGDYLRGLDEYAKSLGVTDYNTLNYYPGVDKILPSANAQLNILPEYSIIKEQAPMVPGMALGPTLYSAEEYAARINPAVTAKTPYEQMVEYRLGVPINYGLTGKDVNPYQTFDVRYNTPVALLDLDGNVLASGTGFEAAQKIADQAYNLSRGSKTYTIATADPSTGQWTPVVTDAPNKSAAAQFASLALPVIGAAAAGPLGAALGSAAGGTLEGKGIGDILKNAAIAGGAAYLGGELMQGIDGATPAAPGTATSGIKPSAAFNKAFSPKFLASISNTGAGIGGAVAPTLAAGPEIVVKGVITPRIESAIGAVMGGAGIGELSRIYSPEEIDAAVKEAQARSEQQDVPADEVPGWDVVAPKQPPVIPPVIPQPQPGTPEGVGPETVVEAPKKPPITIPPSIINAPAPETLTPEQIQDKINADQDKGGLSTLDKIRLGLLGADLVSGLLKSGADNSAYTDTSGPLSYTPLNRTAATPTFDPFTYGQDLPGAQKGEFLFFQPSAAKQATQPVANTLVPAASKLAKGGKVEDSDMHDDMIKHLMAYRSGGGHMGPGKVKGIGSGQEDLIPAWLSDGEYVWSAQDVADLGDGSTDEGVRRLDKMREMVRKQAGRKNVKKIAKPQKGIDHMLKAVGGRV